MSIFSVSSNVSGINLGSGWCKAVYLGTTAVFYEPYTAGALSPELVLDFASEYYRTGGADTDLVSAANHTRASSATYVDATGTLQTAAINEPRVGHHIWNGSAWVDEGYFHESEARTNLLLNSDTPSTQSATVTAVAHTLHFTGTGTITLSGASTAGPLVGTGTGENNRVSLTFTPTAGTLTLTVSGTVINAQVEAGSTPSSYIPTAGATATRAADTLTVPVANLPWPEPVVIGPELVTNGTFDVDTTGWTPAYYTPTISVVSQSLAVTDTAGANVTVIQNITVEAGKVYALIGTVTNGSGLGYYSFTTNSITPLTGKSRDGYLYYSPTVDGTVKVTLTGRALDTVYFDNISVKEINPLAVSIQMEGTMTYADDGVGGNSNGKSGQAVFYTWWGSNSSYLEGILNTASGNTGVIAIRQDFANVEDFVASSNIYSPGINVPFNIASRHGSTFINGAVDGTALTANLTPTALPDLSATDMDIGYDFMGTIKLFRVWADDLTDAGIAEATT